MSQTMNPNDIPEAVMDKLHQVIVVGDYEYADNYRACRTDDPEGVAEFNRAEASGCCGSHNENVVIDGVEYQIGFNYGH